MDNLFAKNQKGFSMIEIALIVVIFGAIIALGAPVFADFKIKNDLDVAKVNVVSSLRRAQSLSQVMKYDSSWGVHVTTGEAIIFQGDSYETRVIDNDESLEILSSFSLSGLDEVVFHKLTGNTSTTGSIVISSNRNESKTITINEQGTVSF